jgi:hypothetical protein
VPRVAARAGNLVVAWGGWMAVAKAVVVTERVVVKGGREWIRAERVRAYVVTTYRHRCRNGNRNRTETGTGTETTH